MELARLIWRDFLAKVHLFRGCTGQFLDAMCVLLQETNYGPEEMIGVAGEVSTNLVILVYGGLETYSNDTDRIKRTSRKGHIVGFLRCAGQKSPVKKTHSIPRGLLTPQPLLGIQERPTYIVFRETF